ncbi:Abc1 family protein, partial [Thalictrum thalictroides]
MNPSSQSDDLQGTVTNGAATNNAQFFYDSPIQSDLEAKLKQLLIKLASANKIIGIQVCVYKDGKVVIDSVAGVLGENDPRPVQHDSLFPVFSATKGIAAGMVHWLVDNGKLKLEDNIENIWPGFGVNKKDSIKVHHVLNHTSGLHNANSGSFSYESNWKACLDNVVTATPESEPGHLQLYHYASFGFLCGGIVEHASGKKFQEVLDEAIVRPLNIEGELYIGIPP